MTLAPAELEPGILAELGRFEDYVRSLSPDQLAVPSRCEGWTVGDVAGHVIGSMADVVNGNADGLGTPEVTAREVDERRGRTPAELADELAQVREIVPTLLAVFTPEVWDGPAPGGYSGTLAEGVEALYADTWIHQQDMRAALGQPSVDGTGLRAAVAHVVTTLNQQQWGNASLKLEGQDEFPVGDGSGDTITGDAHQFVLAATGRGNPADFGQDETLNIYR